MLIRVVKMTFREDAIDEFLVRVGQNVEQIKAFEGCQFLKILQDQQNPCRIFTYSYWESEELLNAYRNSDFFKNIWSLTKQGFAEKPEAWSLNSLHELS